jgi:hypothetical protein
MKTLKKPKPVSIRELTAQEITNEALLKLKALGCTVWRHNNSAIKRRKNVATPGIPDIIGYDPKGRFIGCEVKKIGDKFSEDQKQFLAALEERNGQAMYAVQEGSEVVIKYYEMIQQEAGKDKQAV